MSEWSIDTLLPHAGAMILLDAVIEIEGERIVCTRRIRAGGVFNDADGHLPAWSGIELMAQCVAAWDGWQARQTQAPVRPGLLVGTRHYHCNVDSFALGSELRIEAVRRFHDDDGMAMFTCRIDADGARATAQLNVFSPRDPLAFFAVTAQSPTHV
jgi:predicted hotdog family 3-hydroxylacyl-ACP dehydratase